jgi:hypothetical protein
MENLAQAVERLTAAGYEDDFAPSAVDCAQ